MCVRRVLQLAWWVVPVAVGATTLVAKDVRQLADSSAVVVRARVTSLRTKQASARQWVTVAECERLEVLRGEVGPGFRVVTPGGSTDELSELVAGAPVFDVGDEVVLFLSPSVGSTEVFRVTGWEQGAWRVRRGTDGSVQVEPQAPSAAKVGTAALHRMPLVELKHLVTP